MKILQICNKYPYPPHDGGSVAIMNMAGSFAESGQQCTIFAMKTKKHAGPANENPGEHPTGIRFLAVDVKTGISLPAMLLNFCFSSLPYIAVRFYKKKVVSALVDLFRKETFDIVQLEGLYLMPYISHIRKYHKGLVVYRAHNIESDIWKGIADREKNPFFRFYLKNLSARLMRYEKSIINRYDLLVPITSEDQKIFKTLGNNKPAMVSPTGIPESGFRNDGLHCDPKDLFYLGSLDWIPNQESILWFLENVWLPLKKELPEMQFHIAGRNAPVWLTAKFKNYPVVYHGEIDDSTGFIDSHSVMIVPLFSGSGLRIKIVEAMARSTIVITTGIGALGMNVTSGKELILAENAKEFTDAIKMLNENPSLIKDLRINAYTFARQNFDNKLIVKNLLYFYSQYIQC